MTGADTVSDARSEAVLGYLMGRWDALQGLSGWVVSRAYIRLACDQPRDGAVLGYLMHSHDTGPHPSCVRNFCFQPERHTISQP